MGVPSPQPNSEGATEAQKGSSGTGASRGEDAPTAQLVAATVGDRCASCSAPLASDQRYCVNCGERRGKSRFSVANFSAQTAQAPAQPPRQPPESGPRFSSSATLVAGIATLLIAMGVGVEIGRDSKSGSQKAAAAPPQVITVNGGGSAGTATTSTTAGKPLSKKQAAKAAKAANAKASAKTAAKASNAASKVLGGGAPKNNTVTNGQSCTNGSAGCHNGKFDGSFFGP